MPDPGVPSNLPASIESLQASLADQGYIAERNLATVIYLSLRMGRPLFLEGEAGVGKTEVAKVLSALLDAPLIRLQCYEGLDIHQAVYDWNYTRQMLHIRLTEAQGGTANEAELFGPEFLLRRPLLEAIDSDSQIAPILLIDEIDRSDAAFEAYLLEVLSDFQITIPEIGTIRARQQPHVVITSNRTREIHDALKRRCLYHWIDYPSFDKELAIVGARVPEAAEALARQVTSIVQSLRDRSLYKRPGVAETLDWLRALVALEIELVDPSVLQDTMGALLKTEEDVAALRGEAAAALLEQAKLHG
jgi:MoxR-like ATPase